MKNLHIVSFDYREDNEPEIPYSIGKIISYLQKNKDFCAEYKIQQTSFNLLSAIESFDLKILDNDFIAIAVYSWSVDLVQSLLQFLETHNYKGKIIVGAYEITDEEAFTIYPQAHYYISGHAEKAMLDVLLGKSNEKFINIPPDINHVCNVYSNQVIKNIKGYKVRLETKRNCPFRCTFCAHKDLNDSNVKEIDLETILIEFRYLNDVSVEKVNVIDPIFNVGKNYLLILKELVRMKFKPKISFQVRFEFIKGTKGKRFLDLISQLDAELEFGLQTIVPKEYAVIKRKNEKEKIEDAIKLLHDFNINYEVSLIYGLPYQTLQSFQESIAFLKEMSCPKIIAYPLMLLKGTALYQDRDLYDFKEEYIDGIPYVCSSNSFTKEDYKEMKELAKELISIKTLNLQVA